MTAAQVVSAVATGAGVLVVVLAALRALVTRDVLVRLHLITPVTSVGGPLIGLGLAIPNGWTAPTAQILVTVFLLALTGPVLGSATGRLVARADGAAAEGDR
ncbi:monovalent cation/H(+) antiporter subunit G [Pseudonocardia sp. RS11V-5]|uniref:monovalent cation/H(+) antiporter subunit G n=1 Tax=Pseudonocardia terrae TaxID=2905831 RepID=UPI001E6365C1|nr:monovalent cation/H(+) antiporter subunit G [Pseudonocardia terrae]MCE3553273.1 monovalent cation/H(+) antiporter subunit G [Pseudonocardia terrae]